MANSNVDSPEFLNLFGCSPVKLIVRVRWLGKKENQEHRPLEPSFLSDCSAP